MKGWFLMKKIFSALLLLAPGLAAGGVSFLPQHVPNQDNIQLVAAAMLIQGIWYFIFIVMMEPDKGGDVMPILFPLFAFASGSLVVILRLVNNWWMILVWVVFVIINGGFCWYQLQRMYEPNSLWGK